MNPSTIVHIGGVPVGGPNFTAIAGPCAIESHEQLLETAVAVQGAGASVLRAGAFKPRTSPRSFQGLRTAGLEILGDVKAVTGMPVVSELTDLRHLDDMLAVADAIQVGSR